MESLRLEPLYAATCREMSGKFRRARFIGREGTVGLTWRSPVAPAPYFRREFVIDRAPAAATIRFCGLGYGELYLDGAKVGDDVLSPTVSVYDRRVRFMRYDISAGLTPGAHTLAVRLGNGWYNCHTAEVWHFDKAAWRDSPKMWLELEIDGETILRSDEKWKASDGGIRFDGLRNGEYFDARCEPAGWMQCGFDDAAWENAYIVAPPGGAMEEQSAPPCRVIRRIAPVELRQEASEYIVDFGENLTGRCAITVRAAAGTTFEMRHYECADATGTPEDPAQKGLSQFTLAGAFQTDRYTACGAAQESWFPAFTYHGFRYVRVIRHGDGELLDIQAEFIASDMARIGDYHCSDLDFMRLKECAVRSYLGNFTGIPTDCPHREKNGWTGDAQLACATGLYLFDSADHYSQWLDMICDTQRPDGQVASIAPTGGWGFNNASGPAWDCALIRIPYEIYLHTGRKELLARYYPNMLRYLEYLQSRLSDDGAIRFGLADWCAPGNIGGEVDCAFASSAYHIHMLDLTARIAGLLGLSPDQEALERDACRQRRKFRQLFHPSPAEWGGNTLTELALALEMDLVSDVTERAVTAARLSDRAEALQYQAQFGILGAKYVPRALAANGDIDGAWRMLTQPEYPGWTQWLRRGATTLWETWEGNSSQNHIMFGDFPAFAIEYLGGIRLDEEFAATGKLTLRPCMPEALAEFQAELRSCHGKIAVHWRRENGKIHLDAQADGAVMLQTSP